MGHHETFFRFSVITAKATDDFQKTKRDKKLQCLLNIEGKTCEDWQTPSFIFCNFKKVSHMSHGAPPVGHHETGVGHHETC